MAVAGTLTHDPAGTESAPVTLEDVAELEKALADAGLAGSSLRGRYSVVFVYPGMGVGQVYPELAGCTTEVCTFIDEAGVFLKHGIQVVGVSGERSDPPEGCVAIPFPVGLISQDRFGGPITFVERGGRRYATRTTFLTFPDGTGVRISGISNVVAHVRQCLEIAIGHRLDRFRGAALESLARNGQRLRSTVEHRGLLPNGADSVAITRVDVTLPLVCKMAAPSIIAAEVGYIDRINRLLEENGRPRIFPAVIASSTEEDPAWYLMEAADPVPLDQLLFADRERTVIDPGREPLFADAIARLSDLYEITFRPEVSPVARYHYRDRFVVIPTRADTRTSYDLLIGGRLDDMLGRRAILDGFACRSYTEQVAFLDERLDDLAEPVGAYLHGDAHLPNMLVMAGGVVFVDPRTVWDGNEVGDPGFGDPVYDLATLLHSVHVMSPILRAIGAGETERLLSVTEEDGVLAVTPGILRIHGNPVLPWFRDAVLHRLPLEILGRNGEARLHVGTANALLGWLKYARSVQTRHAWLAIFVSVLYHLEVARRLLEGKEA